MLEKLKSFYQFLRQKPVLLIVLFVIIVLLIIPFKKKSQPPPENLSDIHLEALNPSLKPTATFDQIALKQPEKQIVVYQIPAPSQDQLTNLFNPIAREFNFSNSPENININKTPSLFWNNAPNFLTVNLQSSSFTLDYHPQSASSSAKLAEIDAINIAKNWLLKYQLIFEDAKSESSAIEDKLGDSYPEGAAPNYQIYFYPTLNNLPIFTPNSIDAPISVIITPQGNIYSVYYRLPAILFTNLQSLKTSNHSILSSAQINQAIKDKNPIITRLTFSDGKFAPSTSNLKTVNYTQITLGYSNEITNNQILPIFQLTGTGTLDNGATVTVTAYLPALAD